MKHRRIMSLICAACLAFALALPAAAADVQPIQSQETVLALEARVNEIKANPSQEFVGVMYFSAEDAASTGSMQLDTYVPAADWTADSAARALDYVAVPIWFDKISSRTVKFHAEVLLMDIIDTFELTLDYDDGTTGYAQIDVTGEDLMSVVLDFSNKTYSSPGQYDVWPIDGELVCSAGVRVYGYDRFICTEATVNIT